MWLKIHFPGLWKLKDWFILMSRPMIGKLIFSKIIQGTVFFAVCLMMGFSACQQNNSSQVTSDSETMSSMHGPEHSDHNPRHGGVFFMSLDMEHHLEGILTPPGTFTVYLYDSRTQPLGAQRVQGVSGKINLGEFPDSSGIPLRVGEDGLTLVAELEDEIAFPLTLTLLLKFSNSDADEKSELFNFIFDSYSDAHSMVH